MTFRTVAALAHFTTFSAFDSTLISYHVSSYCSNTVYSQWYLLIYYIARIIMILMTIDLAETTTKLHDREKVMKITVPV